MNAFTRNMRVIFGVGLSSILLSLTACGDTTEGNAEQTGDGDSLTSISVGTIAIASSVELRYGVENGIFEKHGLDVELVESQGEIGRASCRERVERAVGGGSLKEKKERRESMGRRCGETRER